MKNSMDIIDELMDTLNEKESKLFESNRDLRWYRFELFRGFKISYINNQFDVDFFNS